MDYLPSLPPPTLYKEWQTWGSRLVSQLESTLIRLSTSAANSGGSSSATSSNTTSGTTPNTTSGTITLRDSLGRIIVDEIGLHVYDSAGVQIVNGPVVQIDTDQLADASVITSKLAHGAVNSQALASLAVQAYHILNGAVNSNKIAYNAITSDLIADDAVIAGKIATGAIVAGDGVIANAAITSALIGNLQVLDQHVANLNGSKIAAYTITSDKIAANAVTADKISVNDLSSINTNTGTLTVNTYGYVRGGQTSYATGTGFFLGYSGGAYKFSVGDSTKYVRWDGSTLTIGGDVIATGNIATNAVTDVYYNQAGNYTTVTNGSNIAFGISNSSVTIPPKNVINFNVYFLNGFDLSVSIYRDSTLLATFSFPNNDDAYLVSFSAVDIPSDTSPHFYFLKYTGSDPSVALTYRSMIVTTYKR